LDKKAVKKTDDKNEQKVSSCATLHQKKGEKKNDQKNDQKMAITHKPICVGVCRGVRKRSLSTLTC